MPTSEKTFQAEFDFLLNYVPNALDLKHNINPEDYFADYFQEETLMEMAVKSDTNSIRIIPLPINFEKEIWNEPKLADEKRDSINTLFNAALESPISRELVQYYVDLFGRHAFGCYLPMHKFFLNKRTPWGIYLFPEMIGANYTKLLSFVLKKEITKQNLLKLYVYCVYRHELFHFHTEFFATNFEVSIRKPFYKLHNEEVYERDRDTEDWLEEALAEATVLESRLVANRAGIKKPLLKKIYKEDLKTMPAGYRDYDCKKFGGPNQAHSVLAAQILHLSEEHPVPTSKFTIKATFNQKDIQVPVYMVIGLNDILSRSIKRIQ
jgi:hypothetical protein